MECIQILVVVGRGMGRLEAYFTKFVFYHAIFFHDVTEKKDITAILCKSNIDWNMCFKRLVLNVCSLSVALDKNDHIPV